MAEAQAGRSAMRAAALRYRVMAYITGVLIIVVCLGGITLKFVEHKNVINNEVASWTRFLYIVSLVFAYILAHNFKMRLWPTILLLLACTVPIMTFFVER